MNDLTTSIKPAAWVGQALERQEDAALLTGAGRYADDLGTHPGTLHAAFLRSPHAHARIKSIETSRALALAGVRTVLVGSDVRDWTRPFVVGVKQPMEHWCVAVDKVRYVGRGSSFVKLRLSCKVTPWSCAMMVGVDLAARRSRRAS